MNFEKRLINFIRDLIDIASEYLWTIVFFIWAFNSIFGIVGNKDPQDKPPQKQEVQKQEDGPKPSM